jgi:hypothetical protein
MADLAALVDAIAFQRLDERLAAGAGVKLTRLLAQDLQQRLDPFLMLGRLR